MMGELFVVSNYRCGISMLD